MLSLRDDVFFPASQGSPFVVKLADLPNGSAATVLAVQDAHPRDAIARRLRDLGFVRGEAVRIVARAPFGGDPLVVQVGFTRFALRRAEAARIAVEPLPAVDE